MNVKAKLLFTLGDVKSKDNQVYEGRSNGRNRLKHECRVEEVTRSLVGSQAKRSGVLAGSLLWDCRPPALSVRYEYR